MSIKIINEKSVTPESVLGIELEKSSELEGVIVIAFRKDGNDYLSAACSLGDLPTAQAMLLERWMEIRAGKTPARSH